MKTDGTTVTFFRRDDGALTGYCARGHAGYAEKGSDIVCAAISALTQSTLNGLQNVLGAPVASTIDEEEGLLEARLSPGASPDQVRQAQLLLRTLAEALEAIRNGYPGNVRIIYEERR